MSLRVLVVDDHPLFRFGVCTLLDAEPGIEVAGEAASGASAVDAAAALRPDVVVMDLHLPDLSGIQATRHIVTASPDTGVLMLTMADESESVFAAMRAGARGYLLKDAEPDEILRAVRSVARREAIFGPDIANRVLAFFNQPPASEPVFPELTGREREVLSLIAAGHSNAVIANSLCLSPKTVRNHISNVFAKLHVADRAEAIVRARDAGLGRS
ncbi:response regulator [Amycolatopsis australiensis]|uniref:DNA-binding response regulator, NarL/FixJ family, contains REC and HTH domains n=1 Tax=Amycolatopsis australiensis TaxID=546364 RepID=A0A1K1P6P4_9PSEU|nr:response regulator transcription factor [Amycolatopsis australiensis]SFW43252.1 DNA-binding response regulator, NarL/FixJ family, contains REC and HTH domains [Amycolatopsis australiensis]